MFFWIPVCNNLVFIFTVAHSIYGVAHTINSANYIYFLGLQKVLLLDHQEATKVFTGKDYYTSIFVSYGHFML
jgi:hypothetical protein